MTGSEDRTASWKLRVDTNHQTNCPSQTHRCEKLVQSCYLVVHRLGVEAWTFRSTMSLFYLNDSHIYKLQSTDDKTENKKKVFRAKSDKMQQLADTTRRAMRWSQDEKLWWFLSLHGLERHGMLHAVLHFRLSAIWAIQYRAISNYRNGRKEAQMRNQCTWISSTPPWPNAVQSSSLELTETLMPWPSDVGEPSEV